MARLCYELEVERCNAILNVMNDGHWVDWMERNCIIPRKVMMDYVSRHCKVVVVYRFGRMNVIGL